MATKGTATLDFGAAPGADEASVTVATTGLSAGSHIEAFAMTSAVDATSDNGVDEHEMLAALGRFSCAYVDATHFTIKCNLIGLLAMGQFSVRWVFD